MLRTLKGSVLFLTQKRYLFILAKTKSLVDCGLQQIKDQYQGVIHGPTADEILKDVDLSDKVSLITGANSGIGLEMTRCLSSHGCAVLMACRNTYAANAVMKNLNNDLLKNYEINLASLKSVQECSEQLLKDERQIDIVILNAGVFGIPWTLTEDNLETLFQVNYFSQWYLLMNIEKILAPDARVVIMSSESHRYVNWPMKDQLRPSENLVSLTKDDYTSIKAYNISKLCGILMMHYVGCKWLKTQKSIFTVHPGSFVNTRLCCNWWPYEALYKIMLPFSKTTAQAACTPLYCATSPDLEGMSAQYYKDCQRVDESELASDLRLAFRINDLSREMLFDRMRFTADDMKRDVLSTPQTKEMTDTLTPNYST